MARRGRCRCGFILCFQKGAEGYKTRCPECGAVVRLRSSRKNRLRQVACSCGAAVTIKSSDRSAVCPECFREIAPDAEATPHKPSKPEEFPEAPIAGSSESQASPLSTRSHASRDTPAGHNKLSTGSARSLSGKRDAAPRACGQRQALTLPGPLHAREQRRPEEQRPRLILRALPADTSTE